MLAGTPRTVDRDAVLKRFVDNTREVTGTQVCSVYLWDETSRRLVLAATNGLATEGVGIVSMRLGKGVTGWVADNRRSLAVPNTREEPRFHWIPGLDQERFISMLSVPVLAGSRLVGVVNVQTEQTHHFTDAEIAQLEAIAGQVAAMVEEPEAAEGVTAEAL
ncbi:MAG TPA: GAF domain-containing protein [Candidatus Solibacter sp.]|jgi:signal transduction protein with GAF and PtsI domain|nr:GAF domain-containing protein [Candidatus Solibacter sp.]